MPIALAAHGSYIVLQLPPPYQCPVTRWQTYCKTWIPQHSSSRVIPERTGNSRHVHWQIWKGGTSMEEHSASGIFKTKCNKRTYQSIGVQANPPKSFSVSKLICNDILLNTFKGIQQMSYEVRCFIRMKLQKYHLDDCSTCPIFSALRVRRFFWYQQYAVVLFNEV